MKKVYQHYYMPFIIELIKHDLRIKKGESLYKTAKESGLRLEIIKKLEAKDMKGSAESLCDYIDSYMNRFPMDGYMLMYKFVCKLREQPLPLDK